MVTVKVSSGSSVVSLAMLIAKILLFSPGLKLVPPLGNTPPGKSAADAGLAPEPVTVQLTVEPTDRSPLRPIWKAKPLVAPLVSERSLRTAKIDTVEPPGGGGGGAPPESCAQVR